MAQVAAAIGRDFSHELLAAAVPLAEPELQEALRRLAEAGLVFQRGVPPAADYLFKHALVQDTAYRRGEAEFVLRNLRRLPANRGGALVFECRFAGAAANSVEQSRGGH